LIFIKLGYALAVIGGIGLVILLAMISVPWYISVPLALALLLHSLTSTTIKRFVQNVAYLPHFISWVIVVALFQQILGGAGVLNGFLGDSGLHTVDIIGNPELFKPLLVLQCVWKDSGWGAIIFLAALSNVDETLYEASAMDGAGPWRRFWHVTLPALRPIIVLLLVMRLGEILSVGFEQVLLQRDAVGAKAGEILDTFVYYQGIVSGDFPMAAAAGIFKGVIGAALVYAANKIAHRLGEPGVYR
jgi:putative aldouronate transport system permease protein